ncbi:MAG: 2-oxo acid dehydrogenase subunit E2 [Pseudomonadota bacterium]
MSDPAAIAGATRRLGPAQRQAARFLAASQAETAVVTIFGEIDVGALLTWRSALAEGPSRPSVSHCVLRALALALPQYPALAAHLHDDVLHFGEGLDIALAVSLPSGDLITPVLRGVESMDLAMLTAAARDLAEKARTGGLAPGDVRGGHFTLSNVVGAQVTRWTTPIVPRPQVAILALAGIRDVPAVRERAVTVAKMLPVSLSFDHRAVNGTEASAFLETLAEVLAHPETLAAPLDGGTAQ